MIIEVRGKIEWLKKELTGFRGEQACNIIILWRDLRSVGYTLRGERLSHDILSVTEWRGLGC